MEKRWRVGFLLLLAALAVSATNLPAVVLHAQQASAGPATSIDVLDGHRFSGEFVPSGKVSGRPDEFIFSNGRFHSRECLQFGFLPGPYWLREENGRLHFLARLTSEENGTMTYEGVVTGERLKAQIEWIKPRWYWTMKRNFQFEGVVGGGNGAKEK